MSLTPKQQYDVYGDRTKHVIDIRKILKRHIVLTLILEKLKLNHVMTFMLEKLK